MNDARLRAWWWHRQGLDGSLHGSTPAAMLERSGWARSVGGVGPYLSFFARGGTSREAADQAVAGLAIHELPAARGCTYVLPARDFALGLAVGRSFGEAEMKTAAKLGVTEKEVETLCAAVLAALTGKTLDPDEIRAATGRAARKLGEEGKKRGMITTLPLALGRLQSTGEIRRVPVEGRLDQQRFKYTRWTRGALVGYTASLEESFTALARQYFGWVGPATVREFQWFSGLGVKTSQAAVAPLELQPIEPGSDRLLLPDDVATFAKVAVPRSAQYALVSSLDAISAARRDVTTLVDAEDHGLDVLADQSDRAGGRLMDLPSHAILDRGRLIGLWEYDPDATSIVWATFNGKRPKELRAKVDETEAFVRDQLSDARSFSLDSPKSRRPRIEALARMD